MRALPPLSLAAVLATLTTCKPADEGALDTAALYAGRERVTIAYDANLWGELIECG